MDISRFYFFVSLFYFTIGTPGHGSVIVPALTTLIVVGVEEGEAFVSCIETEELSRRVTSGRVLYYSLKDCLIGQP